MALPWLVGGIFQEPKPMPRRSPAVPSRFKSKKGLAAKPAGWRGTHSNLFSQADQP